MELLELLCARADEDLAPGPEWDEQAVPQPQPWQFSDAGLVAELRRAQRERSRAEGRWLAVLAEAERREATLRVLGLPTSSWLVDERTHAARTARAEVRLAVQLDRQPVLSQALTEGGLSVEQARTIAVGLARLPEELDGAQVSAVAETMVAYGRDFDPYGLARLVHRAVEVVAPEVVDDADRRAVDRLERQQQRSRFLTWRHDPDDGSLLLNGKLPHVAGEQLVGLLKALGGKARAQAARAGEELSRGQAYADAVLDLARHYAGCKRPPRLGADRPRILVSIDHEVLCGRLGTATLLNTGERISARQARVLACDAGILPVVLGGRSVPLDVGRERRLFTGPLRALLIARDQGCVFPGCDRAPADCDAHHIQPWHAGGRTSLGNGVLLCPFHHQLVEPDPARPPERQWQVRLDARGRPEFAAPCASGAPRTWRQHTRHRLTC